MLRIVLAVLATWRVTHLLASEDGPADIIFRFRRLLGQSLVGKLMDCFNCLSLWIAAPGSFFSFREDLSSGYSAGWHFPVALVCSNALGRSRS